ncbi:UNVERIFIED_CONTAM: Polypeptide N-acetylgalactosaminyltransferase 17 [Gekko kuhli]
MASLRRVKVLLILNLIAVAGFVLFLAKCRPVTVKGGEGFHEVHPRAEVANLTVHAVSPIQEAVLKRLSLLEDIVYRQLNGRVLFLMRKDLAHYQIMFQQCSAHHDPWKQAEEGCITSSNVALAPP